MKEDKKLKEIKIEDFSSNQFEESSNQIEEDPVKLLIEKSINAKKKINLQFDQGILKLRQNRNLIDSLDKQFLDDCHHKLKFSIFVGTIILGGGLIYSKSFMKRWIRISLFLISYIGMNVGLLNYWYYKYPLEQYSKGKVDAIELPPQPHINDIIKYGDKTFKSI